MSDKQLLSRSCNAAGSFPKNVVRSTTSRHHLEGFFRRLNDHKGRLFCEDGKASLDLWEFYDSFGEFRNVCVSSNFELKGRLEGERLFTHEDPRSRFIFIHAPNSRERLRVSYEMITCALTHHQVMPNFLDFIFPFGYQHYAEDFHFSGFREDTRLSIPGGGLQIPELGRSGREVRICYSLKSVEPHIKTPDWPWSVRQAALYHSFDLETGKTCWVVVKGSNLIRDRIQSATSPDADGASELPSFETNASSFASTLATHLVLCDWCDEDWRWYLTFLEKRLQDLTRRALAVDVPSAPSIVEPSTFHVIEPTIPIRRTFSDITKKTLTIPRRIATSSASMAKKTKFKPSFPQPLSPPPSPTDDEPPQLPPVLPPGMGGANNPPSTANTDEIFSVGTLQKVQAIEDKANEVLLNLESNIKIVSDIRNHYRVILDSEDCPPELVSGCKSEFAHFQKRIDNIIGDLEIQHTSAKVLLRLVENRESLLSGLLNLRNIEASKELAKKSQYSAKKMEAMTEAMHQIAVKTKQETVSMRIITLVTLFFLPGTFISTIMSTDIITWQTTQESGKVFQLGALQLYLAITIPMMLLVFAAWGIVFWWVNRRQDLKEFGGKSSGWVA